MKLQPTASLRNIHRCGFSVLLPTAGMEICRLYAVASLLYLIPESPPYPFAALACVLTAGILAERGLSFISTRRIIIILVNVVLCGLFVFFFAWPYSGHAEGNLSYGFAFWLNACAVVFFFFRGVTLGAGNVSHSLTITRYDTGIGVFFFMYFLRVFLSEADTLALRVVGAYFLFSILALSASRFRERDKNFTGSRPAISIVISFAAVFFLAGLAIVLLYPFLTRAAGNVYTFLSNSSGPVLDFLIAIIRFLFGFGRKPRSDITPSPNIKGEEVIIMQGSEPGIVFRIIMGIFLVISIAALIVLTVVLLRALLRYLAGKRDAPGNLGFLAALRMLFRFLLDGLRAALHMPGRAIARIRASRRPLAGAGQEAFRKLCDWGKFSGVPRKRCETPDEYVRRLAIGFPSLQEMLSIFARGVEEELYGRKILATAETERLKAALKYLSNPALIPSRFTSRLRIRGF